MTETRSAQMAYSPPGHRVLVVEDDDGLRNVLARGLSARGFDVVSASDGAGAVRSVAAARPDAVVLDIGLPDADGRDVCAALRAQGLAAPVLFLTARANLSDRLSGFACGGDDYLPKPFAFPELLARLSSLLRRSAGPECVWEGLVLDPTEFTIASGEHKVNLSPIEFRLLAKLLSAPSKIVRRLELTGTAWPPGSTVSGNTLDQYIRKLRQKLVAIDSVHTIEAARGIGYRLT